MNTWLEIWLRVAAARILRDERGQADMLIIILLLILIYMVYTGRRLVVE